MSRNNIFGNRPGRLPTAPAGVGSIFYDVVTDTVRYVRSTNVIEEVGRPELRVLRAGDVMTGNLTMSGGSGVNTPFVENPVLTLGATASSVNIGTGAASVVNIGTGAAATTVNIGAGAIDLLNIGCPVVVEQIDNPTGVINLGNTASTVNVGTGNSVQTVNVGTGTGVTTINLGGPGDIVNIQGTLTTVNTTNTQISDRLITLNANSVGSGTARIAGIQFRDNGDDNRGFIRTNAAGTGFEFRAPETSSVITLPNPAVPTSEIAVKINDKITTSASVFAANELVPRSFVDAAVGGVSVEIDALTTTRTVSVITPSFPVNTGLDFAIENTNSILIDGDNINQSVGVVRFHDENNRVWHAAFLGPSPSQWEQNFNITTTNLQQGITTTANELFIWQTETDNNIVIDAMGGRRFSTIRAQFIESYAISAFGSELHVAVTLFNPSDTVTVIDRMGTTIFSFGPGTFGFTSATSQVLVVTYNIVVANFTPTGWYRTISQTNAKLASNPAFPHQNPTSPRIFAINYVNNVDSNLGIIFSDSGSLVFSTGGLQSVNVFNERGIIISSTGGTYLHAVSTTFPIEGIAIVPGQSDQMTIWGQGFLASNATTNSVTVFRFPLAPASGAVTSALFTIGYSVGVPLFHYTPFIPPEVSNVQIINFFTTDSFFFGGAIVAGRFQALVVTNTFNFNINPSVFVSVTPNFMTMIVFNNIDLSGGVSVITLGSANLTNLPIRGVKFITHSGDRMAGIFTGVTGTSNWIIDTANPSVTTSIDSGSEWLLVWQRISALQQVLIAARRIPITTNRISNLPTSVVVQNVYRAMASDLASIGPFSRSFAQNTALGDNFTNAFTFTSAVLQTPRIYFVNYIFMTVVLPNLLPTGAVTVWKRIMNRRGGTLNVQHPSIGTVSISNGSNLDFIARNNNTVIL